MMKSLSFFVYRGTRKTARGTEQTESMSIIEGMVLATGPEIAPSAAPKNCKAPVCLRLMIATVSSSMLF